ncbi:MAG: extracellular solute-binding protein [Albidovulum sp.]|nr:extracellular solute-binding protein [Albidovulum sp.]MDE0303472.1 extracellular solute-binding protein [Albidovulum sp.]
MSVLSGFTRRKFLKNAALGAGAAATGTSLSGQLAWSKEMVPPGKKLFNDIGLKYFQDSNWLHAPLWLSDHLMQEAGVGIESREQYDGGDAVAKILPQLLSRQPRFDFVQYPSLFFGAFASTDQLEPLDPYFEQYEGTSEYLDWVMPAYREFYTKWNGNTVGVMLDGDIHILHYRKQHFANPELQKKFSARFQQELDVPKTWDDFLKCAQFFTEELSSQGIYGTSMVVNPPNFGWGFWMDIAASAGVNYFDENMNPVINQGLAAESLDMYREIIKFGPPGAEAMDIGTTIQRWQSGSDVMSVWWIDLAEFTVQQQGIELSEDQGAAIVPGWMHDNGEIVNRAISLWCRTASIPKNLPQDIKDAAFYFIYRMSHPDYSDRIVADPYCGSDPFGRSHYTDEAAQYYIEPNPQRGTNDLWQNNDGTFKTFERARNHLDAGLANVEVGYPQFFWEGAPEYADALGRNISKAISGQLTSQQALDEAAEEWVKIVQKLGIDSQKAQYKNFVDGARALGYKI